MANPRPSERPIEAAQVPPREASGLAELVGFERELSNLRSEIDALISLHFGKPDPSGEHAAAITQLTASIGDVNTALQQVSAARALPPKERHSLSRQVASTLESAHKSVETVRSHDIAVQHNEQKSKLAREAILADERRAQERRNRNMAGYAPKEREVVGGFWGFFAAPVTTVTRALGFTAPVSIPFASFFTETIPSYIAPVGQKLNTAGNLLSGVLGGVIALDFSQAGNSLGQIGKAILRNTIGVSNADINATAGSLYAIASTPFTIAGDMMQGLGSRAYGLVQWVTGSEKPNNVASDIRLTSAPAASSSWLPDLSGLALPEIRFSDVSQWAYDMFVPNVPPMPSQQTHARLN